VRCIDLRLSHLHFVNRCPASKPNRRNRSATAARSGGGQNRPLAAIADRNHRGFARRCHSRRDTDQDRARRAFSGRDYALVWSREGPSGKPVQSASCRPPQNPHETSPSYRPPWRGGWCSNHSATSTDARPTPPGTTFHFNTIVKVARVIFRSSYFNNQGVIVGSTRQLLTCNLPACRI